MKPLSIACLLGIGLAPVLLAGAAAAQGASGRPANLCQELLAFVQQPEAAKQAAATPPQQTTAVSNPSGQAQGTPSSAGGETQQKSGLSGPTKDEGPDRNVGGRGQANANAKDAAPARAPAPAPRPDAAMVGKVEVAAAANDQIGCRAAARAMRVVGVALPPSLLALAALDPKYYTP